MSNRRTIPPVPAPADWHSARSSKFIVYREPQDDSYLDGNGDLVQRSKRIDIAGVTFIEEDAQGNVIPRNTEGYPNLLSFNQDELRGIAQNNPAVLTAYQEAIPKLAALWDAIYQSIK